MDEDIFEFLRKNRLSGLYAEYPCVKCKRHGKNDCKCDKWEYWFKEEWRKIRKKFGR
jgi:hypothetical protein